MLNQKTVAYVCFVFGLAFEKNCIKYGELRTIRYYRDKGPSKIVNEMILSIPDTTSVELIRNMIDNQKELADIFRDVLSFLGDEDNDRIDS